MNASTRAVGVLLVAGIVAWPRLLAAQNVTQQFTYDNLRVSGLQADLGALAASKLRGSKRRQRGWRRPTLHRWRVLAPVLLVSG